MVLLANHYPNVMGCNFMVGGFMLHFFCTVLLGFIREPDFMRSCRVEAGVTADDLVSTVKQLGADHQLTWKSGYPLLEYLAIRLKKIQVFSQSRTANY